MKRFRAVRVSDLSILCAQIGMFLRAGVPLSRGLALLRDESGPRRVKRTADRLANAVDGRRPLSEAMEVTGMFPAYLIRMTKTGEVSGELDSVMESMARFYERERLLREQIYAAVFYPLLLLVALGGAVFFILTRVLPMFQDILQELGGELPGFVSAMMQAGRRINDNWVLLIVLLLSIAALCLPVRLTKKGRLFLDRCKARLSLCRKLAAARFAGAMSLLLKGGVPMDSALDLGRDILNNAYMQARIDGARQDHSDVGAVLERAAILPPKFTALFAAGVESGEAETAMERLAEIYEVESRRSLARLAGSVEPILSAALSILAGVILVSVILPLLSILSFIG